MNKPKYMINLNTKKSFLIPLIFTACFIALITINLSADETLNPDDVPADEQNQQELLSPTPEALPYTIDGNTFEYEGYFHDQYLRIFLEFKEDVSDEVFQDISDYAEFIYENLAPDGSGIVGQINRVLKPLESDQELMTEYTFNSAADFNGTQKDVLSRILSRMIFYHNQSSRALNILSLGLDNAWKRIIERGSAPTDSAHAVLALYRRILDFNILTGPGEDEEFNPETQSRYTISLPGYQGPVIRINFQEAAKSARLDILPAPYQPSQTTRSRLSPSQLTFGINTNPALFGYIADSLVRHLNNPDASPYYNPETDARIVRGYINFSGSMKIIGYSESTPEADIPWKVGILNPRTESLGVSNPNQVLDSHVLFLHNFSCGTCGDYHQYIITSESVRYHNIIDARTAYPAATGFPPEKIISATVVNSSLMESILASRALFILGREDGLELIESQSNLEALIILENENGSFRSLITNGMGNYLIN